MMTLTFRRRALALCALALVAVACGGDSDGNGATTGDGNDGAVSSGDLPEVAAQVNGTAVSSSALLAVVNEEAEPAELADGLRRLIINQVLEDAVSEFGLSVGAAEEDAARESIVAEVTGASGASLEDVLADAGITDGGFDLIVRQTALADAVEGYLSENAPAPRGEDLESLYDEVIGDRATVCAAHILLETVQAATAALDRAAAGEDFGDLARELSTGPSGPNGGDLGCSSPAQYVAPFAAATLEAEIGEAFGPVETQFGFHVILVSDRTVPTLEELEPELTTMLMLDVFPVWLNAQVAAAVVTVDPSLGVWTTDPSPGVIPPR